MNLTDLENPKEMYNLTIPSEVVFQSVLFFMTLRTFSSENALKQRQVNKKMIRLS